jgi:hypothetical protein
MVTTVKQRIEQAITMIGAICLSNQAIPEVGEAFQPALDLMHECLPDFYHHSVNYFTSLERMERTAAQPMILSSAMVRNSLSKFAVCWEFFCETLNRLFTVRPSPHADRISKSFAAIEYSLETVLVANEKRHDTTGNVEKSVGNIQSLSRDLSRHLVSLFSEPLFPNFDNDVFGSYRSSVKGFMRIIVQGFQTDFSLCGLTRYDMIFLRSNVFTHCQTILNALEAAFRFPGEVGSVIEVRNLAGKDLELIFQQLSVQFQVVPANPDVVQARKPPEAPPASPSAEFQAQEEEEEKLELGLRVRLKMFLAFCSRLLHENLSVNSYDNSFHVIQGRLQESMHAAHEHSRKVAAYVGRIAQLEAETSLGHTAQVLAREQGLEASVRDLSGKVEEAANEIVALKSDKLLTSLALENAQKHLDEIRLKLLDFLKQAGVSENQSGEVDGVVDAIAALGGNLPVEVVTKIVLEPDKEAAEAKEILAGMVQDRSDSLVYLVNKLGDLRKTAESERDELKEEVENLKRELASEKRQATSAIEELRDANEDLNEKLSSEVTLREDFAADLQHSQQRVLGDDASTDPMRNCRLIESRFGDLSSANEIQQIEITALKERLNSLHCALLNRCGFPADSEVSLDGILDAISSRATPIQLEAEGCRTRFADLEDTVKALYFRLLGVQRLEVQDPNHEASTDGLVCAVYDAISELQDDRDRIVGETQGAKSAAEILRSCLFVLEDRFRDHLDASDRHDDSDFALIESVCGYTDRILAMNDRSNQLDIQTLKSYASVLKIGPSANALEVTSALQRVLVGLEHSTEVLQRFGAILNRLIDSVVTGRPAAVVDKHVQNLHTALEGLRDGYVDEDLHSVLSKFVQACSRG